MEWQRRFQQPQWPALHHRTPATRHASIKCTHSHSELLSSFRNQSHSAGRRICSALTWHMRCTACWSDDDAALAAATLILVVPLFALSPSSLRKYCTNSAPLTETETGAAAVVMTRLFLQRGGCGHDLSSDTVARAEQVSRGPRQLRDAPSCNQPRCDINSGRAAASSRSVASARCTCARSLSEHLHTHAATVHCSAPAPALTEQVKEERRPMLVMRVLHCSFCE